MSSVSDACHREFCDACYFYYESTASTTSTRYYFYHYYKELAI